MTTSLSKVTLGGLALLWLLSVGQLQAKPTGPISFGHNAPEIMAVGQTVTTTLSVNSAVHMQLVSLSVTPYSGTEMAGGGETIELGEVRAGESHEVSFDVKLVDSNVGYISVIATTTTPGGETRQQAITIRYGSHGN